MDERIKSNLSKISEGMDGLPQGYFENLDALLSAVVADIDTITYNASVLHPRFRKTLWILKTNLRGD